ncbi:MAG: phage holin, LLH family [Candidatus Faecousia sp.]|nr:phage holin, LLH family [Candidatus Faecousia sp.]
MFEYFIYTYGPSLAMAVLCAIFGCLGYAIKRIATKYINDDTKRSVAKVAAQFVEQVWYSLHGPEKLAKALETAEVLLKKKGIDFDSDEMKILIEAAVSEFNEAFKKPVLEEATADAVRRVDEAEEAVTE